MTGEIEALEKAAFDTIASGGLGISTPELLASTAQAQAVSSVVIAAGLTNELFFVARLAPSVDDQLIQHLARATATYDTLAVDLAPRLSPKVRHAWAQVLTNPQVASLRAQEADFVAAAQRGKDQRLTLSRSSFASQLQSGEASVAFANVLDPVLAEAVAEGIKLARNAQSAAASRARTGAVLALLALVTTLAMLVILGGQIRWRLTALAAAAHRLSSGTLEPMPVFGPRQVAIASQGLNDAVLNLREITTKAALIARGNIASPMLERPSQGPLGAAMHASFERVVTVVRDREALQHELAHQASQDALTGLTNRAEAERLLIEAVTDARDQGGSVGLLFIDLNHFKAINDTHGHPAGDHVLRTVSVRLTDALGDTAIACRLGGDEFLVLLPRLRDVTQLTELAGRIREAVRGPVFYQDHDLRVGASIGSSVWPKGLTAALRPAGTDAEIAEQILAEADAAMYRNKAANRPSVTS